MDLWIAEKPSLAEGVARHLGSVRKQQGYIEVDGGKVIVTWCVGHIFELCDPDFYTSEAVPLNKKGRKVWRKEDLPIIPKDWKLRCTKKDQFGLIKKFGRTADKIVNVGDPDREGQLLVDEALMEAGIDPDGKNVQRIWLAALDDDSVKKAIAGLKPNREYQNLRLSAMARSRADWLIGMNCTRAYTLAADGNLVTVGRVQTPTLAIVVARDREIENFRPKDYFVPVVTMEDGTQLRWTSRKTEHPGIDEEGRIVDRALAMNIVKRIEARCGWEVLKAEDKETREAPPLPHSLDSLQMHLSKTHKISAQETLDACQSLYEVHKLTTYPRTDCRYLPESMHADRFAVLKSMVNTYRREVEGANADLKSKAFNDKQITAHHAIIPTGKSPSAMLNAHERAAFEAIAKFYLVQFYPDAKYRETALEVLFDAEDTFVATTKALLAPGWKTVMGGSAPEEGGDDDPENEIQAKASVSGPSVRH